MNNKSYFITLMGILFVILIGCQKEEKKTNRDYPQIRTIAVDQITSAGARFNAVITSGSSDGITEYGFVWGRSDQLKIEYSEKVLIEDAPEQEGFSAIVSFSLEAMKEYFVRSYIKVGNLVVYGDPVSFTSLGSMAPEITDFDPVSGHWGDTITIYGKNFTYQQYSIKVLFGKVNAPIIKSTDEKILVRVPDLLSEAISAVKLNMLGNECIAAKNFTLLTPGSVASVLPVIARWGDTLIIKGEFPYHDYNIGIRINKIGTTILAINENQITAIFPPSNYSSQVEIELGIDNHWIATGVFITMTSPNISSITPAFFGWDDTIVIKGTFIPEISSNQVLFNTVSAKILKADNNSLTCIVPVLNTHSAQMEIKTGSYSYTYAYPIDLKGPEISSITPARISSTGALTVKGKYFNPVNTGLSFNNIDNFNVNSVTTRQITGNLNGNITSNGPVTVTVSTIGKSKSYSNLLTIADPKILSVSPEYSFYGEIVTVKGENFDPADIRITLCNSINVEIVSATATEIQFKIPLNDKCGSGFSLTTRGMKIDNYNDPRITPPVINSISPASGKPGDIFRVTGDYFNPDAASNRVYFDYYTNVAAIDGDRYHLDFKIPSILSGNYYLEISTGASGAQAWTFECNSPYTARGSVYDWQYYQSTVVNGNKMYLLGGRAGQWQYYQTYDMATSQPSAGLYGFEILYHLYNSVAFIIGDYGYFGLGNYYSDDQLITSFYKFSTDGNEWTKLNDFPGSGRAGAFYFSAGNYGYIGTGSDNTSILKDVWQYNTANDTWTRKTDFPGGATVGATAVMHGGSAYVIDKNNIWLYNPTLDQWSRKAAFPGSPRYRGVAIDSPTGIYYGLGSEILSPVYNDHTCYSDLWYYSIGTNTWKRVLDFPRGPRASAFGFGYNDKIYIGGGFSMDEDNQWRTYYDLYEFDPNF